MNKTLPLFSLDYIKSIQSTKYRVRALYDAYPYTIQLDRALLDKYKELYGNTTYKEDSIKRAGRYWRMKHPDQYMRETQQQIIDGLYHDTNKTIWS